jgi:hypothetical protein
MVGLESAPGGWARRNPPNAVFVEMADYDARKILTYFELERFARLIRPCIIKPVLFKLILANNVSVNTPPEGHFRFG